ncbi:uncharacterized protein TRIADDRAFT_64164 [Trichoplax adhaerens]|uniref:Lipocalin/cytosolic fatty-acid binding domain-containing protein n=1 Tax=Trichoplax adhaerens TaxID=10228 RepID=B3S4H0_TRIAD|nr:hypothetical protein TRIADDRAFT_64164 [Trichoplax adhaerens]EDV22463.1 hypothetical protein TRIADDRAFT_64164 [Trichoplax adhaerens]|eukprot:XP_002115007.1 hypothetical protein TRIADDRAFT_64164 [Trichoplax adhaerens]
MTLKTHYTDCSVVAKGVNFVKRKLAKATTNVVQTITIDGDNIRIVMTSPVTTKDTTFIVGQPVEETTLHGEKVKTTIRWEGDKLVAESTECKQPLTNTRHVENGMMVNDQIRGICFAHHL